MRFHLLVFHVTIRYGRERCTEAVRCRGWFLRGHKASCYIQVFYSSDCREIFFFFLAG